MFADFTSGVHLDFLEAPWPLSPASAPTLAYGVCDDDLTGLAGLGGVARLARFLGLPEKLAASVRLQRRRRGGSAGQLLLALLYAACAGGGRLTAVDALGADEVARQTCGLRAVPASRRLGADLQRMHAAALEGLRECVRLVSRRLVAQACGQRWGSVPVFGDGPGIEVEASCSSTPGAATTTRGSPGCPRCSWGWRGSAPGCMRAART